MAIKQNKKNIISIHNDSIDNYYLNITFLYRIFDTSSKKTVNSFQTK